MIKFLFLPVLLALFFSGCTTATSVYESYTGVESNKKAFEQEDTLIMFALRAEQLGDFESAAKIFDKLYEKSNKKEYLYQSLQNLLAIKENQEVIKRVNEEDLDDPQLIRIKIIALVQMDKLEDAKLLAVELVKKTKAVNDYILVSDILVKQQEFDMAVKYLESAYYQDYNETVLDKMSIVLYVNLQREKDAIALLETHTRMHGCSILICKRLIAFYSNEDNIDGLLSIYLRYYELDTNPEISHQIVQLYVYKKEYIKLIRFLEKSGSDDNTLIQLYIGSKNYKKAYPLAQKLYKKTGNIKYLGESAIYEYESSKNRDDKVFLDRISKKFEEVLEQERATLYLNYYGYILIDHDIDVKKGMELVREALKNEPNSSFYLDSLAWGHYKLGECKESLSIIRKVITLEGGDDPEVLKHYELIKNCSKKKKGKK